MSSSRQPTPALTLRMRDMLERAAFAINVGRAFIPKPKVGEIGPMEPSYDLIHREIKSLITEYDQKAARRQVKKGQTHGSEPQP